MEEFSDKDFEKEFKQALLTQDTGELVRILQKQKDKRIIIDLAYLPLSEKFTFEKWLYFIEQLGICFINSKQDEVKREQ